MPQKKPDPDELRGEHHLLKDAAAKAIYGSSAGNGVVVIQTIRPKRRGAHYLITAT